MAHYLLEKSLEAPEDGMCRLMPSLALSEDQVIVVDPKLGEVYITSPTELTFAQMKGKVVWCNLATCELISRNVRALSPKPEAMH